MRMDSHPRRTLVQSRRRAAGACESCIVHHCGARIHNAFTCADLISAADDRTAREKFGHKECAERFAGRIGAQHLKEFRHAGNSTSRFSLVSDA
jgi:hypothetical protein